MVEQVATHDAAVKQRLRTGGSSALDELLDLIRSLGTGLKTRIEDVEARVGEHRTEVEQRLNRYEEIQIRTADRMVSSVDRLSRLEAIPDQLERLEVDLEKVRNKQEEHSRLMVQGLAAVNKRVDAVDKRLDRDEAQQTGKKQALRVAMQSFTWLLEHGWKLVMCVWALAWGFTALTGQRAPALTTQQPFQVQGHAQDWPLRTN